MPPSMKTWVSTVIPVKPVIVKQDGRPFLEKGTAKWYCLEIRPSFKGKELVVYLENKNAVLSWV